MSGLERRIRSTTPTNLWTVAHRLLAGCASESDILSLSRTVDPPSESIPYPAFHEGDSPGEAHIGQFAYALIASKGPDFVVERFRSRHRASEIVAGEERRKVVADACNLIEQSPKGPGSIGRLNAADLSWIIEASARRSVEMKRGLEETWPVQDGRRVSLLRMVRAQLALTDLFLSRPEEKILAESGVHCLMALGYVDRHFSADPAMRRLETRLGHALSRLNGVIRAQISHEDLSDASLSIAGHYLDAAFSDETTVPPPEADLACSVLRQLARALDAGRELDPGLLTHCLRGLRFWTSARAPTRIGAMAAGSKARLFAAFSPWEPDSHTYEHTFPHRDAFSRGKNGGGAGI
ncbi:MAG: hypothetical protein ABI592_04400 [Acidobacteriota bacterium]